MMAFSGKATFIAIAALALAGSAGSAAVNAAPGSATVAAAQMPSSVVHVYDDGYRGQRRYRRGYRNKVVRAPFTRVESGRRTVVDAPFVHVYKGRRGKRIVAPFVDIWEPR